ncbi:jun dimerization protein 2 isoform X3 [Octodon degus]|uniref:Jun dimerization protein 2 isoform X3 n=1 Tax=Octodon degus TaxID=10160 RepID=A0A6P6DI06_OCTDE|nr:jun dimerization protein 2 isoform X3 [Octodon degus]
MDRLTLPNREAWPGGGHISWLPNALFFTEGWLVAPLAMMPGQIPDPSVTAGSLPGLGPLTGLPSSALTAEELKYADIRNIGAMIAPLHFLEVKLGKRPQPMKSELDEEEERRKRRREKNKVAAARCRNKKKERTEFLQRSLFMSWQCTGFHLRSPENLTLQPAI